MASPPRRMVFVSAGDHRVVFDQREATTHKFSANGAAMILGFTPTGRPRRLHSFGKDGDVSSAFKILPATLP